MGIIIWCRDKRTRSSRELCTQKKVFLISLIVKVKVLPVLTHIRELPRIRADENSELYSDSQNHKEETENDQMSEQLIAILITKQQ
jgi:hypothetical protein